jgi:hypothetical protein
MFSKISFSMQHVAKSFNLSCNIADLKQYLSKFSLEKLLSAEATKLFRRKKAEATNVKRMQYATDTFG